MAIYTDAKIDGHSIKLILDSGSAGSIITRQLMDQLDNLSIEVNGIIVSIKELQLSQNEAYQVSWANTKHNKLLLIPLWDDKEKKRKEEKLTRETDQSYWNSNHQSKQLPIWTWEEKRKEKEEEPEPATIPTYIPYTYSQPPQSYYCQPKLICINCGKKLLSMSACCGDNEKYLIATKFYCCPCIIECFGRPKQVGK
ncbi:hypothetical protein G9A89_013074 [Geosiphon pyriformis]|nr:hypothetical protein G9A89_013074 [Geosiphon pyriformis]